jgi:hypothetical protein
MLRTAQKFLRIAHLVIRTADDGYEHKDVKDLAKAFKDITKRTDRAQGLENAYTLVRQYYKGPEAKLFMEVIQELLDVHEKDPKPITKMNVARVLVAAAARIVKLGFGANDLKKLMGNAHSFGVVSAYRGNLGKSENQKRHGDLIRDIQKMRLRYDNEFKSKWAEDAHVEKGVLIRNIGFEGLKELSDKYEQEAFLYKHPSGTIGVYFATGKALMAYDDATLEADVAVSPKDDQYSKGRNVSFGANLKETELPWDGKPITMDDLKVLKEEGALAA